ncbi:exonuclease domain-containing protein [Nocardioides sp. NPDC126508]
MDKLRSRRAQPAEWRPGWNPSAPRFSVLDVETTGLRPDAHRIIEVAVVTTDPWGRLLDQWSTRVNPQGPVGATHIHGITVADVAGAPTFEQLLEHLSYRLAGSALVAHNASFDMAFLDAEYRRAGWALPKDVPHLCTLEASQHHLPRLERRRLGDCCWAVGHPLTNAHSALGDALATASLLGAFMHPHYGTPPTSEHLELPQRAQEVAWPTGPTMAAAEWTPPAPSRMEKLPERVQLKIRAASSKEPVPELVELVERFSLIDALDEGAPEGSLTYLEKLAEVLEDGEITDDEATDLAAVAEAVKLEPADVAAANRAFLLTLAHAALEDGRVTRAERSELKAIADLLDVNPRVLPALLDHAEHARNQRLSVGLRELPEDWPYGDPVRVGDKVAFTGCDDQVRAGLEERSESLGVRVIGSVSPNVTILITDGGFDGTKAARARELGTRTVHPRQYGVLLDYLQPSLPRSLKPLPKVPSQRTISSMSAGSSEADGTAVSANNASVSSVNPTAVRQWGRENGWELGARGRLPRELIDAYAAAHSEIDV